MRELVFFIILFLLFASSGCAPSVVPSLDVVTLVHPTGPRGEQVICSRRELTRHMLGAKGLTSEQAERFRALAQRLSRTEYLFVTCIEYHEAMGYERDLRRPLAIQQLDLLEGRWEGRYERWSLDMGSVMFDNTLVLEIYGAGPPTGKGRFSLAKEDPRWVRTIGIGQGWQTDVEIVGGKILMTLGGEVRQFSVAERDKDRALLLETSYGPKGQQPGWPERETVLIEKRGK